MFLKNRSPGTPRLAYSVASPFLSLDRETLHDAVSGNCMGGLVPSRQRRSCARKTHRCLLFLLLPSFLSFF